MYRGEGSGGPTPRELKQYVNQVGAGSTSLVSAWSWDPTTMQNAVLLFWM